MATYIIHEELQAWSREVRNAKAFGPENGAIGNGRIDENWGSTSGRLSGCEPARLDGFVRLAAAFVHFRQ